MKFKDYYEVLGLARSVTQDEIKRAYRKLARKFHPDVSKEADAEPRFKELGEAYAVLKDPEKRAAYDRLGSQRKAGQDFQPPPDWDAGFEFSGGDAGSDADGGFGGAFGSNSGTDQSEFFEALFGRLNRSGQQAHRPPPRDHHAKVMIDLADAYRGARRSIVLSMPELDPQGHLTTRQRTLEVGIPKGVRAGQHLRLAGQGSVAANDGAGGVAGDLYLEIAFNADPLFRVEGRDVYLPLPLAPWEAALGASIAVPTPDGALQLSIPAGSAAGRQLRMKGRGIPGTPPGDLYALLSIALPPADTTLAQDAYRAMATALKFNPRAHFAAGPEPASAENQP